MAKYVADERAQECADAAELVQGHPRREMLGLALRNARAAAKLHQKRRKRLEQEARAANQAAAAAQKLASEIKAKLDAEAGDDDATETEADNG